MSSKLHRGGALPVDSFSWHSIGVGSGLRANSHTPPEHDLEAACQAAFQKGLQAGESAAEQRAAARLAPALENFASIVKDMASAKKHLRKEAEEPMVRLALAIARRILHREIATDPEAILGLIRAGLDKLDARERFSLRLAPVDAAVVREKRGQLDFPEAVEIVVDAALSPGSAVFETARGELDASAGTQLDEIERGFTDLMRRRPWQK